METSKIYQSNNDVLSLSIHVVCSAGYMVKLNYINVNTSVHLWHTIKDRVLSIERLKNERERTGVDVIAKVSLILGVALG